MEQIVQVRIPGARRSYAYTWDGWPELAVGDWVELPGNEVSPEGTEGRVEGFGSDGYKGPMKAITAVKEPQDPWFARMRQVKTPSDRLQVYRKAVKAGVTGDRLAALVAEGKRVLDDSGRPEGPQAAAGSLGRVDAGASQETNSSWGEWE